MPTCIEKKIRKKTPGDISDSPGPLMRDRWAALPLQPIPSIPSPVRDGIWLEYPRWRNR